jgi:hypothetical protein
MNAHECVQANAAAEYECWLLGRAGVVAMWCHAGFWYAAGMSDPRDSGFKIIGRSPHDSLHGLYRALILAHRERA